MNHSSRIALTHWRGLPAVTLRSRDVALSVVPGSGARVVSLRSLGAKREWLWQPPTKRSLARRPPDTPFEESPLVGIDECVPTVAPCRMAKADYPDHGEAWRRAWKLDRRDLARGRITTTLALRTVPAEFSRTISLCDATVTFAYRLTNRSRRPLRYLWALHPLLRMEPGDTVELAGPREVTITATSGTAFSSGLRDRWPSPAPRVRLDRWSLGRGSASGYCKAFLATAPDGIIAIANDRTGARLTLRVEPEHVPAWGYWVTRAGAWHGHTHAALEPTNAPLDALADVTAEHAAAHLGPRESRLWRVEFTLSRGS